MEHIDEKDDEKNLTKDTGLSEQGETKDSSHSDEY